MFEIKRHKIFQDFTGGLIEIATKLREAKEKHSQVNPLSMREKFILDTFHKLIEIEDKLKDLNFSIYFISKSPIYKPLKNKMTRKEYIVYHLEYYYISIIALFDRLLHLINFLYDLGLSDRFVQKQCIIENTHINREIKNLLNKIYNAFSGIRGLQNTVKHKKKLKIGELYNAELLEFNLCHEELCGLFSKITQKELREDMKFYYRRYLSKKKKEMKKDNNLIGKSVEILLDNLYPQYKGRLEKLMF